MTRKELIKSEKYNFPITGSRMGYISRKANINELQATPYNGKYGKGYKVELPRWDTSRYISIEYYIEK